MQGLRAFDQALITGFDLACVEGPLCKEPLMGIAFVLSQFTVRSETLDVVVHAGAVISMMRDACLTAVRKRDVRLMVAMYRCTVQTSTAGLGKAHGVLAQRHAKVRTIAVTVMIV